MSKYVSKEDINDGIFELGYENIKKISAKFWDRHKKDKLGNKKSIYRANVEFVTKDGNKKYLCSDNYKSEQGALKACTRTNERILEVLGEW